MPSGQPAYRTFKCRCGKTVSGHLRKDQKWCSTQCYRSRPVTDKKWNRCKSCKEKCARTFCCIECHDDYQSRHKLHFKCLTCGEDFSRSPSVIRNHGYVPRYCSIPCRTACPVWRRNAAIQGNLVQQNQKTPNKLEVRGEEILKALGVDYRMQHLVDEKFVVDVLIGDKLVVQWDGDYWHGYRAPDDYRSLDARQVKRMTFDRSQDAYLRSKGYRVLRFWEHEVWKEEGKVREAIRNAI